MKKIRAPHTEKIVQISSVNDTYAVYEDKKDGKKLLMVDRIPLAALVEEDGVQVVRFMDFDSSGVQDFADDAANFVQFIFSKEPVSVLEKIYPNTLIDFNN